MNDKPLQVKVLITESYLETFGGNTLIGTLSKETGYGLPPKVILAFPETTRRFKEKNGGPHQYIVNEHTVRCLVNDIMHLREKGVEVVTETYIADPK